MNKKMKYQSRILEAVHEGVSDLYVDGAVDASVMRRFDELCLPVPMTPEFSGVKIKALRERYAITQAFLATILNTSVSTVRQWEIGAKHPSGPSSKLLDLLERKGLEGVL